MYSLKSLVMASLSEYITDYYALVLTGSCSLYLCCINMIVALYKMFQNVMKNKKPAALHCLQLWYITHSKKLFKKVLRVPCFIKL